MPRRPIPWQTRIRAFFDESDGDACWPWKGSIAGEGYGHIRLGGRGSPKITAHRAVWLLLMGPIADDLEPDHLCRNRACVNPNHQELVTHKENTLRGEAPSAVNARKTTCAKGHLYDAEYETKGRRYRRCRKCFNEWCRDNQDKRSEQQRQRRARARQ